MDILFLSTWFPSPPDNGSKIRVHHLVEALAIDHKVTLVSFAFDTANAGGAGELRRLCRRVEAVRCDPFCRGPLVRSLRFFSPVPIVNTPISEMSKVVRRLLSEKAFDVVIASTEVVATYALQVTKPVVRVLEEHNSMTRWMHERYLAQKSALQQLRCWVSWQKQRFYEASLLPRFDLCTMVSEQDRAATQRMVPGYRGRVEVVPNGVDLSANRPGLTRPKRGALVYAGALTYGANYDAMRYFLAEIYPLIRAEEPEVSLTITGSTSGVDLSGLRLDASVHFCGYVDDVRPVVAGAWASVVPIREGSGTRLKILEAMALGTPVVSTSKGAEGLSVRVGHDALIVDRPVEFARQVTRLLRSTALREQLAVNGRQLVERAYDWRRIGQRFVALIEETRDECAEVA